MNRRRLLSVGLGGFVSAVAGCTAVPVARRETSDRRRSTTTATTPSTATATARSDSTAATTAGPIDAPGNATALARRGSPSTICERASRPDFTIREIVEPAFAAAWPTEDAPDGYDRGDGRLRRGLGAAATVFGVSRGGSHRAYPLTVVAEHEAVNDDFGGPLLVTYCPLCRSPMVADRLVNGEPTTFHVSGNLWRIDGSDDNLVLYDAATGSYWSQILATAICGPAAGTTLSVQPSTVTTWGEWLDAHPETEVLLPPPASKVGFP